MYFHYFEIIAPWKGEENVKILWTEGRMDDRQSKELTWANEITDDHLIKKYVITCNVYWMMQCMDKNMNEWTYSIS